MVLIGPGCKLVWREPVEARVGPVQIVVVSPVADDPLATRAVETEQSFVDFLEDTLIAERDSRRARSAATLVRMAGFPATKTLENYDFGFATIAPKRQIEHLASLNFVARRENLVFLGPSGVGKTHLAIALVKSRVIVTP